MKNLLYLILAVFLIVGSGCSKENGDLLDKAASGDLTAEIVFKNYDYTIQYLSGVYGFMPYGFHVFNMGIMDGICDDLEDQIAWGGSNAYNGGGLNPQMSIILGTFGDFYTPAWKGIRAANVLMENIDLTVVPENITNPEQQKDLIRYQARFCRAFIYASLFEYEGGMSILKHSVDAKAAPVYVQRSTYKETTDWLCSEFDTLAKVLPLEWPSSDYGRPTIGACLAAKARVLLIAASPAHNTDTPYGDDPHFMIHAPYSLERWKQAADAAKAVIDMNYYSLKPGKSGYYNVWFDHTLGNKEYIFFRAPVVGNFMELEFLPKSPRFFNGSGNGNADMVPTQNLVDAYEVLQTVAGVTTAVPFDWNNPVHKANPYSKRDPRFYLSIYYNGSKIRNVTVETFQGGLDATSVSGYFLKKFLDSTAIFNPATQVHHDFPYLRYSDVLLMYAEALNEYYASPTPECYAAINQVRNRVTMPSLPAGLTQLQMRDRIINERHVELAFEQRRIFDVKRWLIQDQTQKTIYRVLITKNTDGSFTYEKQVEENRIFLPAHLMWPILDQDVQNSHLYQNPLY